MNSDKVEDFVSFLFSSGLLQDVAYGVTNIKFDDGSKETIPHAILTTTYSHVISLYKDLCAEINFTPLSDSSLWRILRALKPSQRKSLSGLDDMTAAGMNGFSQLESFIASKKLDRSLLSELTRGKRYLKSKYQSHFSADSPLPSSPHRLPSPSPSEKWQSLESLSVNFSC